MATTSTTLNENSLISKSSFANKKRDGKQETKVRDPTDDDDEDELIVDNGP